jgi:hypothetical protein
LNTLNVNVVLLITVVEVKQPSVLHDGMVLLRDLVTLGKVWVDIVFPVKLDEGRNATFEGKRAPNCLIKAVLIQNGKHTRDSKINKAHICVWFLKVGAKSG